MLLPKPLIERKHAKESGDSKFDFTEVMIHSLIETIEFVLGTVSNTASYLRLWALSLAHSQLSKVFFENLLAGPLHSASTFSMFMMYIPWITVTLSIMMCMDLMECSLHTLRLHWVEFQSKFFKGQGEPFIPFSHGKNLVNFAEQQA